MRQLGYLESARLARRYGFDVVRGGLAGNMPEARKLASQLGFPLVIKISSQEIIHKAAAGGVVVGIRNQKELVRGYEKVMKAARAFPKARLEGVIVQEMAQGFELIIGAKRDETFGPVIIFGSGGLLAEELNDIQLRILPVGNNELAKMISQAKAFGAVKKLGVDAEKLRGRLMAMSKLITKEKTVKEIDINPLIVNTKNIIAADIRVISYGP